MLNERNTLLEDDGIEEEILVEEECSVAQAVWGDILGNIENQTDLQNALDAKQDSLTETQLSAVNSGITSEKVTTYDGYADQIASKADQSALNAESIARGEADTALGTRIDNEALARQSADNGLQSQIDAITSKSDVVDVVANYAALQAYDTSTLGNNDVVKVLDDETHEDALTYYRWSTTTQTWSYIGQEAPYYSKGQMDVMLQGKQNTLTAGANIQIQNGTISATDTTYTAGNGLNLNGTEFSADTTVLATKEDLENHYTKTEADNLLAPKLEAEVVAELPTTGEEGKLYLTPKAHTTSTATGNPITASVAEEAGAIESFQLDGDTFQQTYTGKNLLPLDGSSDTGLRGIVNADGSLTIRGTAEASRGLKVFTTTRQFPAGTYTLSISSALSSVLNLTLAANVGFRIPAGETSITTTLEQNYGSGSVFFAATSGQEYDITIKAQLVSGSTPDYDFEPYVGGQPSPNPDYPQPIQTVTGLQTVEVRGKNLFVPPNSATSRGVTFTKNEDGSFNISGKAVGGEALCSIFTDINLKDGESLTLSSNVGTSTGVVYRVEAYNGNTWIVSLISHTSTMPKTITIPQNATRLRYSIGLLEGREVNLTNVTFQLEKGTATAYEPYHATDYPISLGSIELCKLGTYQDYIWKDGDDWKVHKEISSITLDGTEGWAYADNYNYARCPSYIFVDKPLGGTGLGLQLSNYFGVISDWGTFRDSTSRNAFFPLLDEGYKISIRNTNCTSVEDYKSWLATNKPSFYYPVETPTDTVITDQALIAQLEAIRTASLENGANTITNTATGSNLAGDMEIGYYGFAPRNRYDKWLWLDLNNNYEQIGGE